MAKSQRSEFVYKPRDPAKIKERATRKSGKFDSIFKQGFDTFKPQNGENCIRFLPPTWEGFDHYGYSAYAHKFIGPDNSTYLCPRKMLNKPCPICEASKEAKDAGEAEEAKALSPSERVISWVLDRDGDDPEKPLLYDQSWTQDRDVTSLCVDERKGGTLLIDHPDNGFDVTFRRQGGGLKTKYYGWAIAREESPIHESQRVQDEILDYITDNPVPETLNFYDYNYLKGVLSGTVEAKDDVLGEEVTDDEVAENTSRGRAQPQGRATPSARRASVQPETAEDPPFETDEHPVVTRPAGRRRIIEEVPEDEPAPPRRSAVRGR
jgi:gp32 DNA binding protein like